MSGPAGRGDGSHDGSLVVRGGSGSSGRPGTRPPELRSKLEHVRPRNILIGNMIERSEQLTAGELIGYLNRFLAGASSPRRKISC